MISTLATILTLAALLWLLAADSRAATAKRPPLLKGERPWHATWRNPVNRNLIRLAKCETGYLSGGRINWRHSNSTYVGGLGFTWGTWRQFRVYVRPLPPQDGSRATPAEQLAVGRKLVQLYRYTPWPACHVRLGIY